MPRGTSLNGPGKSPVLLPAGVFVTCGFAELGDHFIQRAVELLDEIGTDLKLQFPIGSLNLGNEPGRHGAALGGDRNAHPPLVMVKPLTHHETEIIHARQHAGQTGARQSAYLTDLPWLKRPVVQQSPHDTPLLLRQTSRIEQRTKTGKDTFAGLQEQKREIAADKVS